jgi:hypothetical protein
MPTKIIQILSHLDKIIALDNEGNIYKRSETDNGWYWDLLPTEFEE